MSNIPHVIAFDDEHASAHQYVGGKASSLGRLVKAGFPVPPGFTISTAVYVEFLAGLQQQVDAILAQANYDDAAQLEKQTAQIRELIIGAELPATLAAVIIGAWRQLGDDATRVAVRSSGTAEDLAEASFAGLHDTYLDVRGEAALMVAVKRCWASLWNARAVHYRHEKGFDNRAAQLAVVVQKMVPSAVAGVMFTANPLNTRTDEFVINASWGLGEAVVSGIVTPDEYVVDRQIGAVKASTCGSKEMQIIRNPDGDGTLKESVPVDKQREFSLSNESVSELAALGLRIMNHYDGLPQDIEWAWLDGRFYVLQARAVTGVEFTWDEDINDTIPARHDDETVWTSTWADDFLTGGVTPLYYSVRVGGEFQRAHDHTNRIYGFPELEGRLIFKYRRATAFFNCDVEREWNVLSLPSRLRNYDYVPHTWDDDLRKARFSLYKIVNRTDEANGPTPDDLRELSDDELEAQITKTRALADEWVLTLWAGFNFWAVGALGALAVAVERWYDGDNPAAYQDLISGMPNTLMIQESRVQWHLADTIRHSPALLKLFNENEGPAFFAALPDSDEGRAFLERYDQMLRDHGHRGHQDRDIYYTRRIEDRNIDYRMLRAYLAGDASTTPEQTEQRLIAARELATEEVLKNIASKRFGAVKVSLFKRLLSYVHKFLVQRDDERHYYDRITYQTKKVYAELGRRMYEQGLFSESDDFYFLARDELYELKEGRASGPLTAAKVVARKAVFHRRNRREEYTPPYLVGGNIMDMKARTEALAGDQTEGEGLRGLGTAVGVTTGIARIVPNLEDIGRVQKGDIISGLVLETGGLLAHGACLSREYGLPSVLLRHAMNLLEDGAQITIDGASGVVTLVPESAELAEV